MSDSHFDISPGSGRQRYGKQEFARQAKYPAPQQGLGHRGWRWRLSALPDTARRRGRLGLLVLGCAAPWATSLPAAEAAAASRAAKAITAAHGPAAVGTNAAARFDVRAYIVKCDPLIFTNAPAAALSEYTGTNVGREQIVRAASEVLLEFQKRGYPKANIAIAQELITNGIVTMNVFQGAFPQVLISGKPCFSPRDAGTAAMLAAAAPAAANTTTAVKTNAPIRLNVRAYEITGDTLLSTETLMSILAKHTGTNIPLPEVLQAASALQMEYRNRGYPTVNVTVPPQTVTNGIFKIRVFQGRLSEILVEQNRYFSSNNVMRALPSLRTNIILNGPLFQAELDRANANQDRQIYPQLEPGLQENTTILHLEVKDRLPLHAKVEFNNENSPGTPDLRINTSASYQNLWQLEHSIGVQYSFSPEYYKAGESWNFYDQPLVANYGGFYRLPLANPESVAQAAAAQPDNFGYDEATRKFRLPPASGSPELNFFASRSTIDTGLETLSSEVIYDVPGIRQISRQDVQQDWTITSSVGSRLSDPLPEFGGIRSSLSGGLDFKTYSLTSYKTNLFQFTEYTYREDGSPNPPIVSTVASPVPTTYQDLEYVPLALRYDASLRDSRGVTTFGLGLSANAWYSGSLSNLQTVAGSSESSGNWVILTPTMSRDFLIHTNWILSLQGAGQWASSPLISNEQFGLGGVNTVRGYEEGQVFGDTGWWLGIEQKTPPQMLGLVYPNHPLTVRGSVYMEYGEAYLLDPQGRQAATALWGTGFGGVASIGATWEARLLFSWPLLSVGAIQAYQPRFNFSLSAQF